MSDAYVIEVHGTAVGLIVRYPGGERGYRFLSSLRAFDSLEGRTFATPFQAERAARDVAKAGPPSAPTRHAEPVPVRAA